MKAWIISGAMLCCAANAMALQETSCSNADGSLTRKEQEVWGANPINWTIDGASVSDVTEKDLTSKRVFETKTLENSVYEKSSTYVVKKEVSFKQDGVQASKQAWVICTTLSSRAID